MMTLIIGDQGSMGTRYRHIMDHIGQNYIGTDMDTDPAEVYDLAQKCDRTLICSPTDTHLDYIELLHGIGKPIMCEKPISKNLDEMTRVLNKVYKKRCPFRMVMQYKELTFSEKGYESFYDYYKHGSDGLIWDCIQIIGLAKGNITLNDKSPVWRCQINGDKLNLGQMDFAYVQHIRKWKKQPIQSMVSLMDIHYKTATYDMKLHARA